MPRNNLDSGVVDLPSQPILKTRLAAVLAEAKRLRLLIRTAKELERIEIDHEKRLEQKSEADHG